jgi:BspA type Leucine rich repeat region (6 copies)
MISAGNRLGHKRRTETLKFFMSTKFHCFIALMLLALPAAVQAQFNFTTNNGTITITQYTGSGGDVTIPDTINGLRVTTIGDAAFYQIEDLTSVTIGTNVTTIADNAIFQCPSLTSVTIPGSVTNIGQGPFIDCQSLTVIAVSAANSHYTNVNQLLFNKAQTSLIQFPDGIGGSYTLPAAVTNIGTAFVGNTLTTISVNSANLFFSSTNGVLFDKSQTQLINYPGGAPGAIGTNYTIPSTVSIIVSAAFEYSTSVTNVTIGTSVTNIGLFAFYDSASLTAISVNPASSFFSSTNGVLLDKKKTLLIQYPPNLGGNYVIPNTVTNIGDGAFGDAFNLTGVVIPNSVTNIGNEAFYSCESLSSVVIGNHVANIGELAFFFCIDLTDLVIPASVTNIDSQAFSGCESLSSVCFQGKEPIDGGSIFFFDNALPEILYISGTPGWGATYDGIVTAPCSTCGGSAPELVIIYSGTNVILAWSADFIGYTLQSSTNLASSAVWSNVSPDPSIVNNFNVVTNAISGPRKFYRLSE